MDSIVNWIYSDGNIFLMESKVIVYVFALEFFAYIVSLLVDITRTACK